MNVRNKKCLDVEGNKDQEGQNVLVWKRHNKANQRWKVVYLDKKEKDRSEGLNQNFGFHVNRPFYIQSRLPMKRVIEAIGANNLVIKSLVRNRLAQQFFFDQSTKTIKSQQWKTYSMNIQSNGNSNNLQVYTTNSRWWQLFRLKGAQI